MGRIGIWVITPTFQPKFARKSPLHLNHSKGKFTPTVPRLQRSTLLTLKLYVACYFFIICDLENCTGKLFKVHFHKYKSRNMWSWNGQQFEPGAASATGDGWLKQMLADCHGWAEYGRLLFRKLKMAGWTWLKHINLPQKPQIYMIHYAVQINKISCKY